MRLVKARSQKKYCGSHMGRRLLSAAAAFAPQLSLHKLQFIIHPIVTVHHHDVKLEINTKEFCKSLPSTNILKECLVDVAIDNIVQLCNELDGNVWVYIMFDKGQNNCLCKRLAWWSDSDRRVHTVLLDVEKCGGTSKECAETLVHSL